MCVLSQASERAGTTIIIDKEDVQQKVGELAKQKDYSQVRCSSLAGASSS